MGKNKQRRRLRYSKKAAVEKDKTFYQQQPEEEQRQGLSIHQADRWIDNRNNIYQKVVLECGSTVMFRPEVLELCPMFLRDLSDDVNGALAALPCSVHNLVRRTVLWINASYSYGPTSHPSKVIHSTVHHDAAWLHENFDDPRKVHGIEVYSCVEYQRSRLHWNGCGLLLHEFCHLIHQFVVYDGLNNQGMNSNSIFSCVDAHHNPFLYFAIDIMRLYKILKCSKKYERVPRRDWGGRTVEHDFAYALVNYKEFFAEMSVSFLASKCESFTRNVSSPTFLVHSPRLCSPSVYLSVIKRHGIGASVHLRPLDEDDNLSSSEGSINRTSGLNMRSKSVVHRLFPCLERKRMNSLLHANQSFCNKFFPFTRQQLKSYDYNLFLGMETLWLEIERWNGSI